MAETGKRPFWMHQLVEYILGGAMAGMQELDNSLDARAFGSAVDLLAGADAIWIAGSRRSFPVAAYLDYALQHTDKRIQHVTALGSMHLGQMRSVRKGDVMIAISFSPYAEETIGVAKAATERGASATEPQHASSPTGSWPRSATPTADWPRPSSSCRCTAGRCGWRCSPGRA